MNDVAIIDAGSMISAVSLATSMSAGLKAQFGSSTKAALAREDIRDLMAQ